MSKRIAERPFGLRDGEVEGRNHPFARARVGDGIEDRIVAEQRIARKVHLRDQPAQEVGAEQREVDVRRPPRVRVVQPGIRARPDRGEAIPALVVGQHAARAGEVRVERRRSADRSGADSVRPRWPARSRRACSGSGRPRSSSTRPSTMIRSPSGSPGMLSREIVVGRFEASVRDRRAPSVPRASAG